MYIFGSVLWVSFIWSYQFRLSLAAANLQPGSGIAAWSKPRQGLGDEIHVYASVFGAGYGGINEYIYDPLVQRWSRSGLFPNITDEKPETPIAVVYWSSKVDGKNVDNIRLYYISLENKLMERSWTGASWEHITWITTLSSSANGLAVIRKANGEIRIYAQTEDNKIQAWLWVRPLITAVEFFYDVLPGSCITAYLDDSEGIHLFYQQKKFPYAISGNDESNGRWTSGIFPLRSAAPEISFVSVFSSGVPKYQPSGRTAQFFSSNDQLYSWVTWTLKSSLSGPPLPDSVNPDLPIEYHCGERWCSPWSIARTNSWRSRLAVISSGDTMRLYFVTKEAKLGEMSNVLWGAAWRPESQYFGTGWAISRTDILSGTL